MEDETVKPPTIEDRIANLESGSKDIAQIKEQVSALESHVTSESDVASIESRLDAHLAEWEKFKVMLAPAGFRLPD
jgi:hypothetical protein